MATRCVTFLSDFGNCDTYVAEVKAVLLGAGKSVSIVDLTHETPAFDIEWGAFQLLRSYRHFPKGTIHLAVVDPGVGTPRNAIYVKTKNFEFVGPDNGLLKWAVEELCEKEKQTPAIFEIPVPAETMPTFHGRDIFAPFIVKLLKGKRMKLRRLESLEGESFPKEGCILGFDHYGNAVTSLVADRSPEKFSVDGVFKTVRVYPSYQAIPINEIGMIRGSHGFWEISARENSAKELLTLKRGAKVVPQAG